MSIETTPTYIFDTVADAQAYISGVIDTPVSSTERTITPGLTLTTYSQALPDGRFTNVYDISYSKAATSPAVKVFDAPTSVYDTLAIAPDTLAASGGGFFYLADQGTGSPRQSALNLAIAEGTILSLPVADKESVVIDEHSISAKQLRALGTLSINGKLLQWSGSLTDYQADCQVFGNGNVVINHVENKATGSVRVLDEASRYTPKMPTEANKADIGFISQGGSKFIARTTSRAGELDIFAHDIVLRCDASHIGTGGAIELDVHTIDSLDMQNGIRGALSVGPMIAESDFENHPINRDASLGSKPPFIERPLARTALFETVDNVVHFRLFDGRPGSSIFSGVTPSEAKAMILQDSDILWGCFLDPGQTAKLCARNNDAIDSFGNTHYLKWPISPEETYYTWIPHIGRPVASIITL
jgi:hypothetical protein